MSEIKGDETHVCVHCRQPVCQVSLGDETWDYCTECEMIEPGTITLEDKEYEYENP